MGERSETHPSLPAARLMVGFAALNPPYAPRDMLGFSAARRVDIILALRSDPGNCDA
jgi:hypothetical protein